MDLVEIVMFLEDEFSTEIPEAACTGPLRTVGDAIAYMQAHYVRRRPSAPAASAASAASAPGS